KDQLNNAANKKESLTPRIDLAKKRVEQFTALSAAGAGKRADLEQAQSDLANLQSEFLAADATESQARAQISKSEADLINATFDLEGTTYLAPANGRVANLALRPGVRATQFATMPVMSFIEEDDPWLLAFFRQNELRYVEAGNEAEIYMMQYPGRIIKCMVDSILWATAQGQMPISGNLQNTLPVSAPEQRIAVRLVLAPKDRDLFLAAGARGGGAIYTQHGKMIHIVRKVFLRVSAKLDWFVWKLHYYAPLDEKPSSAGCRCVPDTCRLRDQTGTCWRRHHARIRSRANPRPLGGTASQRHRSTKLDPQLP